MHPLVGANLLRGGRPDALVLDAQAHPPHGQVREPAVRPRHEGRPVIGANSPRQPVLAERPLEDRARLLALHRGQPVASEQKARVLIRDRQ
jgi:hypothetical protein